MHSAPRSSNLSGTSDASLVEKSFCDTLYEQIFPMVSSSEVSEREYLCLLGVSGGCDSVALFHLMRQLQQGRLGATQAEKIHLRVVHFDHQQRGINSDMDRELVEDLCSKYQIPLTCYYWDQRQRAEEDSSFSQALARSWRQSSMYQLLHRLLQGSRGNSSGPQVVGIILTAHHLDDSNETLWLKFLRGTHIAHLQGMPVVSQLSLPSSSQDFAESGAFFMARPLLHLTKTQIMEYLRSNKFVWREDESNQSSKYLRNRVRNELVPLLEDLVGGPGVLQQRMNRLALQSNELDEYLTGQAEAYLALDATRNDAKFFVLPREQLDLVHKHALVLWVRRQSCGRCSLDATFLERVCAQLENFPHNLQWSLNIGGGWDVVRQGHVLSLAFKDDSIAVGKDNHLLNWSRIQPDIRAKESGRCLRVAMPPDLLSEQSCFVLSRVAEYPKLTMTPPWRRGHSPLLLAEFLRGQKVALHERMGSRIIVLRGDEDDAVVVAVYVASKEEWIVDASFEAVSDGDAMLEIDLQSEAGRLTFARTLY